MTQDPIVQETREARAALFAQCDHDLAKLMDRLEASEQEDADRVVTMASLRRRRQPTNTDPGLGGSDDRSLGT